MVFPRLVPKKFCKTPITVTIYSEGLTEDGAPETVFSGELMCNYQEGDTAKLSGEKKDVESSAAVALFDGDFCPEVDTISGGKALVLGKERRILKGQKWRNPDGTVNYTRLDLI